MTDYAYRPRVLWMQGTEPRSVECSELLQDNEIETFGLSIAEAIRENGAFTFEALSGNLYTVPAMLLTEVCYQRVEVARAHRPETTEQHHCCENPTACDGGDPPASPVAATLQQECCVPPSGVCTCREDSARDLAEQEARHPGLSRLLNAAGPGAGTAANLAAMDAAGPTARPEAPYAERKCPCWPGHCTCTEAIEVQGIPYLKGPLHAPHVTDPEHGGRDGA